MEDLNENEGFVIIHKTLKTKAEAEEFIKNSEKENLKILECNEYPTLGFSKSRDKFFVFDGFYSSEECKEILMKKDRNTSAVFASKKHVHQIQYDFGKKSNKISINRKFNDKAKQYRPIYITNIILLFVFYFLEIIVRESEGAKTDNAFIPVYITFLISRFFTRKIYSKNPNFKYKIPVTFGVYISVFIIKVLLFGNIMNLFL